MNIRILDKYILKEMLGPFVFGVCAFTSIFIAGGVLFRLVNLITLFGASYASIGKLFFLSLPEFINYTFPMSVLLASLLTFGRLSASSEITAIKCGGVSFYRMSAPVFGMALCISVFSMFFAEKIVPAAKAAYNNVLYYEVQRNVKPRSQNHIVIKDTSGAAIERLTYARRFEEADGIMYDVIVEEFKDNSLIHLQNAEKATWREGAWLMENGVVYDLSAGGGLSRSARFREQLLPVKLTPRQVNGEQKEPAEMSIGELRERVRVLDRQYAPTERYRMEMYQRFTIPLASVIFALIGTPLGLQPQRSSSSIGLGLSIIIIFVYYAVMTLTLTLGKNGGMPPLLAAVTPDALGLLAGLLLIRKFGA
jgi:lipopolysaccharide export system permease protein